MIYTDVKAKLGNGETVFQFVDENGLNPVWLTSQQIAKRVFNRLCGLLPKTEDEFVARQQAMKIVVDANELRGTFRLAAGYKTV